MPRNQPSIYHRPKDSTGKWLSVRKVQEGRGKSTGAINPPFYIRPVMDGRQVQHPLVSTTFTEAKEEAIRFYTGLKARAQGMAVPEIDDANRVTLQAAVTDYIEHKRDELGRRPGSIKVYQGALSKFVEGSGVRYIDEVTEAVLRRYLRFMKEPKHSRDGRVIRGGYAPKTISTRMTVIFSVLKKYKIEARVDLPKVPTKTAVKFPQEVLTKLFAAMDEEEKFRYNFFIETACREQEVMYASWGDIDFGAKEYTVQAKPDVGFEPKDHETRRIPLSDDMVKTLKQRSENSQHPRWIFINGDNNPESHFLDKFKRIALRAGVNCGHCLTTRNEGRYKKRSVQVSCETHPVCEKIILHRLRKTKLHSGMRPGFRYVQFKNGSVIQAWK
jgi:integrase